MILSILSYLVIPLYTLLFVRETDLFSSNFSVIGSLEEQKNRFSVWAILLSTTLYRMLFPVIGKAPFSPNPVFLVRTQGIAPQNALFFSFKPGPLLPGCHSHPSVCAFRPSPAGQNARFLRPYFQRISFHLSGSFNSQLLPGAAGSVPAPDADSLGFLCGQYGSSAFLRDCKQRSGNSGNHYRLYLKPPALSESF